MLDPRVKPPEEVAEEPVTPEQTKTDIEKYPPEILKRLTLEPWHVEDTEAEECIPKDGFIRDYINYSKTTCDGALWFQLAGALTLLSVIASKCDCYAQSSNGKYGVEGLHLWNALVGLSGNRKSQAIEPAIKGILKILQPKAILATDGSLEAYHDCLANNDHQGNGLLWRDEMETLFKQAKRSYSMGLPGWMLEAYGGGPVERVTMTHGPKSIDRVRLNVIGNIPPSVLQTNTSRDDWRSGFMPRFCFWGARRIGYKDVPTRDAKEEGRLANQLRFINGKALQVIADNGIVRLFTDWYRKEVDSQMGLIPDELFSSLARAQSKGMRIACLYALAQVDKEIHSGAIKVTEEDVQFALRIAKLHKRSTEALFAAVGGSDEATMEQRVITYITRHGGATASEIAAAVGVSVRYVAAICTTLAQQGVVEAEAIQRGGKGRPSLRYILV